MQFIGKASIKNYVRFIIIQLLSYGKQFLFYLAWK